MRFSIGNGYAVYRGPSEGGTFHRHAAFQVAIAVDGEVTLEDAAGGRHRDAALIVPPMARHRMLPVAELVTYFIDPHCTFADRLRERCGEGVTTAPSMRGLREEDVRASCAAPSSELDPRLVAAMTMLTDRRVPMPSIAARVGLSPQRLRALAREQLGLPLVRWAIWSRLGRATEALRAGRSLADAAVTVGFVDQAHLTRRMREMVGITPAALLPALLPALGPSVAIRHVDRD